MDDLISRQVVLKGISLSCTGQSDVIKAEAALVRYVEKIPSAQPEIIRCKDCEHWDTSWQNDYSPNYHYCPLVDGTRRDDFYCADAERRTDG